MDYKLLLDTAVMAGELMLANGAETYRVEDTMQRMLELSGLKTAEAFVMVTGFLVTLDDPSIQSMTVTRRIQSRGTNLSIIDEINSISRGLCGGELELEEAFRQIKKLKKEPHPPQAFLLANAGVAAAFALTYGGTWQEAFVAGVAGFFMAVCLYLCSCMKLPSFFGILLSAVVISLFAGGLLKFLPIIGNLDSIIIAAIMPLVPGVAITNAVFDTLHGDYISGSARMMEAFVVAASVAMGIVIGLRFIQ